MWERQGSTERWYHSSFSQAFQASTVAVACIFDTILRRIPFLSVQIFGLYEDTSVSILTNIQLLKTSHNFSRSNLAEDTSAPCPEKDVVAAPSQALSCL